ncbi:MAG: tRNA pseudouridine(13) synthase TruD [Candidatus Woesearchaeota archaeon]
MIRLLFSSRKPKDMEYIIKHIPDDFVVEEVIGYEPEDGTKNILCRLEKTDTDMFSTLNIISGFFKIDKKEIGYAGIKDKKAMTKQHITLPGKIKNKFKKEGDEISLSENLKINFLKGVEEHIRPGDLKKNRFDIVVRALDEERSLAPKKVPNLFGTQRFGEHNHKIGERIIKRDFEGAAALAMESQKGGELIRQHLRENENDFVGALNTLHNNILTFLVHSYQSHLWNKIVERVIEKEGIEFIEKSDIIPIPGFSSDCEEKFVEEYDGVLEEEGISERDFIIKEMPRLSCEGSEREVLMRISDFAYGYREDDIFKKKKKCELSFSLGKGSYATTLIEHLFN